MFTFCIVPWIVRKYRFPLFSALFPGIKAPNIKVTLCLQAKFSIFKTNLVG